MYANGFVIICVCFGVPKYKDDETRLIMFDRKTQEEVIYENIKAASNEELAREIVFGKNSKALDNAVWVKETMQKMEEAFDNDTLIQIRMGCQCGYGMDEKKTLVKELYDSANSMEEFADNEKAHNAGLFIQNGELFLSFPFCPCPMLADVDKLETKTWCYCTLGYSKRLFEDIWGCPVELELLKSVKMGDDMCLMKISPLSPIW